MATDSLTPAVWSHPQHPSWSPPLALSSLAGRFPGALGRNLVLSGYGKLGNSRPNPALSTDRRVYNLKSSLLDL